MATGSSSPSLSLSRSHRETEMYMCLGRSISTTPTPTRQEAGGAGAVRSRKRYPRRDHMAFPCKSLSRFALSACSSFKSFSTSLSSFHCLSLQLCLSHKVQSSQLAFSFHFFISVIVYYFLQCGSPTSLPARFLYDITIITILPFVPYLSNSLFRNCITADI